MSTSKRREWKECSVQFDDPQLGLFGPVLQSQAALKLLVQADLDALDDAMIGTRWRGLRADIQKGLAELERTAGRGERAAQSHESAAALELLWFVDKIMATGDDVLSADQGGAFEVRNTCGALRHLLLVCDIEELALRLTVEASKGETTFSYDEVEAQYHLSKPEIGKLVRAGKLDAVGKGRETRITLRSLVRFDHEREA